MSSYLGQHFCDVNPILKLGSVQAKQEKAGYGLVLALQVSVPHACLTCVQTLSGDYPDHPHQIFCLEVSDVQTAVALEDTEQDVRWVILPVVLATAQYKGVV